MNSLNDHPEMPERKPTIGSRFAQIPATVAEYIRRPQVWGFLLSLVVIAILAMAFFHPDAAQGNILGQDDMQQGAANGNEVKEYIEQNPDAETPRWTNALFGGMPTFQISPDYPSNHLFSWITTLYGAGLPAPSNLLFMMMAGMLILLMCLRVRWYYALIGAVAWGFSSYFIIIIGAGHIWKFVTLAYIPPTIGGIVMAYRGRWLTGGALAALFAMMQIQSNHVQMSYYFLFVVLAIVVCFAIDAIRRKKYATFLRATGALAVAAILAVCANLPSLYNTYKYSKETIRGSHSELSSAQTDAADATSGLDRSYITFYSYEQGETFSLFIPNVKGGASSFHQGGQALASSLLEVEGAQEQAAALDEVEQFGAQFYSQYFGGPEGTAGPVYVGVIIFTLFLLGVVIVRGPLKWALLLMTILSIALALGRNLQWFTDLFIDYVPMYSKFRTVESILVIAEFTIPVLAILALQKLLKAGSLKKRKTYLIAACCTFGTVALICFAGWVVPELFGNAITEADEMVPTRVGQMLYSAGYPAEQVYAIMDHISIDNPRMASFVSEVRYGMIAADCRRSLILVLLAMGAVWYILSFKQKNQWMGAAVIGLLVVVDLYSVDKRYLNHDSFAQKDDARAASFPLTAVDNEILADTTMNFRVMDIPQFSKAAPSYYHKAIGGYHAAKLTRYQDLIDRHLSRFSSGEATEQDYRLLDMLNARYIVTPDGQLHENPYAMGNAWFVDRVVFADNPDAEMAALDTINPAVTAVADKKFRAALATAAASVNTPSEPGDTIYETSYAPGHLTYAARNNRHRVAVFSEIYFPWGWNVTIDGKPAELARVNYLLRAMVVPPGEHTIEMKFDPQSVRTTVAIARWAVIAIYLALLAALLGVLLNPRFTHRLPHGKKDNS